MHIFNESFALLIAKPHEWCTPYVECTRDQQLIPYPGNLNLYILCNWSAEFSRHILEYNVYEESNEIFSEARQSCIVGTPF